MKNIALFNKLKSQGLLSKIPFHELEELLGISTDDFDVSEFEKSGYEIMTSERAGKAKIITNRLLTADLNRRFALLRIEYPEKHFRCILFFALTCIMSFFLWLYAVYNGAFYLAYYSFSALYGSIGLIWIIDQKKYVVDPRRYFYKQRQKKIADYRTIDLYI